MELENRIVVITGAGSGIGRAMAERFARERPRGIVVADRNAEAAEVAATVGGLSVTADLSTEKGVREVVEHTEAELGPIDVFCSNADISPPVGDVDVPDEGWLAHWNIHVMAHVWAAGPYCPPWSGAVRATC